MHLLLPPLPAFTQQTASAAPTRSPSALFMPVISSAGAGPKSSDAIASKHLRRWGWTARGLRAWERIWRSSSLDRKKNLVGVRVGGLFGWLVGWWVGGWQMKLKNSQGQARAIQR
jgi:hypothetical protein